ncbi:MAG: DUF2459 domain-containing protein [Azospirillaceae bacterium]
MARRIRTPTLLLWCLGWLAACASGPPPPADPGPPAHEIRVVRHGWHTGLVVDHAALAGTGLVPEVADFPDARFLEFGWGDRTFYRAPTQTVPMALRAALTPTDAVLHVAPLGDGAVPGAVAIDVSAVVFRRLAAALSDAFDRSPGGRAEALEPSTASGGRFYPAQGTFHVFNTCNTWVVRRLAMAGLDVSPIGVLTAGEAMRRLREAAERQATRRSPRPVSPVGARR